MPFYQINFFGTFDFFVQNCTDILFRVSGQHRISDQRLYTFYNERERTIKKFSNYSNVLDGQ